MTAELTPVVDDPDTGGYWRAAQGGALAIQLCSKCHQPIHLPRPQCPRCGSTDTSWREVEPAATVYSWAVVRHGVHPAFPVPYTLVLVELRQYPQVRLLGRLDGDPDLVEGQRLRIRFDHNATGIALPQWEPVPHHKGEKQ
jgi:uncharacterized OB-fold protein